jgi:lipopolysaccharide heptosyltransferase II
MSGPWKKAKKILAVRLDAIGDVLMTTPALRAIKHSIPNSRITLLTSPAGSEIGALIPEVDSIISYEAPWMKASPLRGQGRLDRAMINRLRHSHFDGAILFTVYTQNPLPAALLCYLADIPLRLAYCRENPYQLLTDWIADKETSQLWRHEVQRQLDLVGAIGCQTSDERLSLLISNEARERAMRSLKAAGLVPERPWMIVHPGASASSRRYPAQRFAAAITRLKAERDFQVVLTGSAEERPLIEEVIRQSGVPAISMAGFFTLEELAASIGSTRLLLVNNTGPAHIAAAVGTPVVDLYALTNPQHTPWKVPHRILNQDVSCKFCYKSICPEGHQKCLDVTSEQILEAVDALCAPDLLCTP